MKNYDLHFGAFKARTSSFSSHAIVALENAVVYTANVVSDEPDTMVRTPEDPVGQEELHKELNLMTKL